jgi:Mn-dependent DtxR family transcriptional regulator
MPGPGRKPTVSDEDILQVFRDFSDPVLSTKDVAEAIDMSRRGAYSRLEELENNGQIEQKKIGQTAAVWWYPPTLKERY